VDQEALHSVKFLNLKGFVFKIDLSKAYDRVNSLFIHLLLIHVGFDI